jgi:hypothetical protein
MKKKIQKRFIDRSLGFPVTLFNAPLINVRGQWALDVNLNDYQEAVLELLARKPARLTGSEVRFIRTHFELTVRQCAERFSIKHPAVIKWEKKHDKATRMMWSTEKDIRLFILNELKRRATEFHKLYQRLQREADETKTILTLDATELAA